jgi:hypothetical protein
MTAHWITVGGFLGLLAAAVGVGLFASRSPRVATLAAVLRRLMATRAGRMCLLVSWVWVGLHLFAR